MCKKIGQLFYIYCVYTYICVGVYVYIYTHASIYVDKDIWPRLYRHLAISLRTQVFVVIVHFNVLPQISLLKHQNDLANCSI